MKTYRKPTTPTAMQHNNSIYTNEQIVYEEIDETSGGQLLPIYLEFEVKEHSTSNPKTEPGSSDEAVKSDTYLTVVHQKNSTSIPHIRTDKRWKIALLVCCIVILGLLSGTGYLLYVTTRYQGQPDIGDMPTENEGNSSILVLQNETRSNEPCSDVQQYTNKTSKKECDNGWVKYRKSCYLFSDRKGTFAENWKFCSNKNASTVIIETEEENRFLRNNIQEKSFFHGILEYWISLVDLANKGKWIWMGTDQEVGFEDWISGEPNNPETENCAVLWYTFDSGGWNNIACIYEFGTFLCEKS